MIKDGRRWNELRYFNCKINTHPTSADGSSYVEQGLTKVLCTVQGPHEPDGRSRTNTEGVYLNVEITIAPFSTAQRKRRPRNSRVSQEMAICLQRLFKEAVLTHLYPRTVVDISLYVVAEDGGMLPACINAATLALVDAGIPMTDYVSGCSAAMYGDSPLLDPCHAEELEVSFVTTGVIGKNSEELSLLKLENKMSLDRLEAAIATCISGCESIRGMMDAEVRSHGSSRKSKTISLE